MCAWHCTKSTLYTWTECTFSLVIIGVCPGQLGKLKLATFLYLS